MGRVFPGLRSVAFFMKENSASGNKDLRPHLFIMDELENPRKIVNCIVGEGEHFWLRETTQPFSCMCASAAKCPLPRFNTASTGINGVGVPAKSIDRIDSMFPGGKILSFFDRIPVPQRLPLALDKPGHVWRSCDPEFKFNAATGRAVVGKVTYRQSESVLF